MNRLEGIRVLSRSEVAGLELLSVQRGDELHAQHVRRHDTVPSSAFCPPHAPGQQCSLTVRRFSVLASRSKPSAPVTATASSATATEVPASLAGPFACSPRSVRTDSERPEPEAQAAAKSDCDGNTCPKRTGTGTVESLPRKSDTHADPRRGLQHTPQSLGRIDDDFDFSAGLASFDKKAVFADIKVRAPPSISIRSNSF